jgi:hypothetical protein
LILLSVEGKEAENDSGELFKSPHFPAPAQQKDELNNSLCFQKQLEGIQQNTFKNGTLFSSGICSAHLSVSLFSFSMCHNIYSPSVQRTKRQSAISRTGSNKSLSLHKTKPASAKNEKIFIPRMTLFVFL